MSAPGPSGNAPPPPPPPAAAPTPTEVSSLLSHRAYDPSIVPRLESYVRAQASVNVPPAKPAPYNFESNRTLAKLYQFFPHLSDGGVVSLMLLLALLEFPSTDFVALGCLVDEDSQGREPCATIVRCADLLETCRFSEFWPTYRRLSSDDIFESSAGSTSDADLLRSAASAPTSIVKLRRSVLHLLSLAYRSAPLSKIVLPSLDLSGAAELQSFLAEDAESGSIVSSVDEGEESVTFLPTSDNTKREKVFSQDGGLGYDVIASAVMGGSGSGFAKSQ